MLSRLSNKFNAFFESNIKLSLVYNSSSYTEVVVVTKDDKVYKLNVTEETSTSLALSEESIKSFIEPTLATVLCYQGIEDITYGQFHAIARTKSGAVYCWGSNNCGQLGNGSRD
jgi:alpha-tubulin suppressor-like RCC1 family protein